MVTNSSAMNTTALDMVNMVYKHIEAGLTPEESERVSFQILCYEQENGEVTTLCCVLCDELYGVRRAMP